jgi:hypothetical protein
MLKALPLMQIQNAHFERDIRMEIDRIQYQQKKLEK